jgi:photosystem II stability/assembly factor-like uncharacterized protein
MPNHLRNSILIASAILLLSCGPAFGQKSVPAGQPPQSLTWTMQDSGTTAGLRGIDSVDGKIAWASGTEGTVLKTIDGGAHWTKCAVPDGAADGATLDFRGVQAWDATTAIVMASGLGDKSRLYKTVDGCKSWKLAFRNPDVPNGFFDSLKLHREQRLFGDNQGFGLLLGDPVDGHLSVFETRDGGHSWNRIQSESLAVENAGNGAFAASNSCITDFSAASNFFVTGGRTGSYVLRLNYEGSYWETNSSPAKRTWITAPLPFAKGSDSIGAFSIGVRVYAASKDRPLQFENLQLAQVAVGGDYSKPNESNDTGAWTSDGGKTWNLSTKPPHGFRSSVAWSGDLKAWIAAGTNGSDISRDDGKTWTPLDDGNWNALSLPFVVGPKGRIARLSVAAAK